MCNFSWYTNTGIGEFYWFFFFFPSFLSNPLVRFDLLIFLGNVTQGYERLLEFFFFLISFFCPLVNSLRLGFNFMSLIHMVGVLVNLFWSECILVIFLLNVWYL